MVDVAVTSQLSQWTFDKAALAAHGQRSSTDSVVSSPKLCDDAPETLRIDAAQKEGSVFQERYLSSEEDLTADDNSGYESDHSYDNVVVHDFSTECKARTMSISRWDKGRSCDLAVAVSYAHAGRPKMVDMEAAADRPPVQQRSASLANVVPITAASKLRKADEAQRLSMRVMPTSRLASPPLSRSASPCPPAVAEPRRPCTSHSPMTQKTSTYFDSASGSSCLQTASARSSTYMATPSRLDLSRIQTSQSAYQSSNRQSHLPPLTPQSPALSFLSSDPYEKSNNSAASPIIKKPAAHRRLRSISMKLSLAKMAISPSKKQFDTRIDGKPPPTPRTPLTPAPVTHVEGSSDTANSSRIRRASTILRPKSRGAESATRTPTPDAAPPMPQVSASTMQQKRSTTMGRLVPRGANTREPTLVLPPCPDADNDNEDAMSSVKSRAIRRRKSLMDFMDSL